MGQTDKHFTFPHDAIGLSLGGGTGGRQRGYESRKGETLREVTLWRLPSLTLRGELIFFFSFCWRQQPELLVGLAMGFYIRADMWSLAPSSVKKKI